MRSTLRIALGALVAVFVTGALTAAPALASGKPVVETDPISAGQETEATLRGTVNAEGLATTYYFEYATEKGEFTHKTEEASSGSGSEARERTKTITGLALITTYYYRIVATNSDGTTYGAEQSFATGAKPTTETRPATRIVGTEVKLHGVINPHGAATTYSFEYGLASEKAKYEHTTSGLSAGSGTTNVEMGQIVAGLTAKTSYRFRIMVSNVNGKAEGSEETFTTTAPVTVPQFVLGEGEAFPVSLEGSLPYATINLTSTVANIACESLKSKGSITGAKALSLTLELKDCATSAGVKCRTEGAEAGLVVLPWNGRLVYISKAKTEVGVLLELAKTTMIKCVEGSSELEVTARGSLIVPVTPVNTKTTFVHLAVLKGNGKGKQELTEYESEIGEVQKTEFALKAGGTTAAGALEVPEALDLTANKPLTIEG
jgi:hypothetical protein